LPGPTLECRELTKRYGTRVALQRVSFALAPGEVAAVLGPNRKLSVVENLRLFARLERLADPERAVDEMLAQAGLGDRGGDEVGKLSGGNRQRVNIAIGLLARPAALLLDEPSASLDPRQRERLWTFVSGLAHRGTTIVYSTHDVTEAERYADRVLVLADGELLFTGTPSELEQAVGGATKDFETAFVRFLHERGH
jgi:ABC-2 type transport system ATP-binding protein